MGDKDVISKHLLKRIVRDVSGYLLQLNLNSIEILETVNQRVEDRRADMVALVESDSRGDNTPFLLHIEVENQNDLQMPLRMMRYYTDIAFQYPGYSICQYVLYIGQNKLNIDDKIQDKDFCYRYNLIDMHQLDCEQFIQEDNPDALVLSILCDFKGLASQGVVNRIIRRLHEITQPNEKSY